MDDVGLLLMVQSGLGVSGDLLSCGLIDPTHFRSLIARSTPDERVVGVTNVGARDLVYQAGGMDWMGARDVIVIDDDEEDALASDAMAREAGRFRYVRSNFPVLSLPLLCHGGIMEWPGGVRGVPTLREITQIGDSLLLTNDPTWQRDYQQVLADDADAS